MNLQFALHTDSLLHGLKDHTIVIQLKVCDVTLQQVTRIAQFAVEIGRDTTDVLNAILVVDNQDPVVLGKRRQFGRANQLAGQYRFLQLLEGPLEDPAPASMAHVLDQVGLDADGRNHLPICPADREGLLKDRRALGRRSRRVFVAMDLDQSAFSLDKGTQDGRLLTKGDLAIHQRFAVDGQNGVRAGLGHHPRPMLAQRTIQQHIRPAQIGQDAQMSLQPFQEGDILFC